MEGTEIRKLVAVEDKHWWYRERRALLARQLRAMAAEGDGQSQALDIGAAGGGNTRVLRAHGWSATALEYGEEGAQVAHERGIPVIRADARCLPLADQSHGLVVAYDILEHLTDDGLAAAEIFRILRPGGVALIAVPCDMKLWSAHDVAVDHVRRYDRDELVRLLQSAGLEIEDIRSWNVLLRPIAAWRRKRSTGSDLSEMSSAVNMFLSAVIAGERYLPVSGLPGISLVVRARRPVGAWQTLSS
ncbi:bifunctional 2-polyprenyl-6-hydroxyphenol methylase/3-demethylubiquinol 3-O-methyltransferase UbiG [Kribbella sp. VKM Ac-2568]|uniref:class I SAM-dependent methyltransferase n=1 Tax=Kribbella sp. VKM Ac-2568 TaxID=2512219 RepID=UPI00104F0047|nr:class I SAM-dependent methyltransferase [Kribbella sp. VKM Ac-2568]TCM46698.1 methyltransferase family protein [Kribbella sp. VKM Ac-2568]